MLTQNEIEKKTFKGVITIQLCNNNVNETENET